MPWGVAAIRGSFWSNLVTDKGNSTSLLEGEAEVTSGGQTQSLGQLQSTTVTAANAPPSAPTQMTAAESKEWVEVKTWVEAKAQEIASKQEAAPPPPASVDAPPAPSQPTTVPQSAAPSVPNVINAVSSALSQAASTASGSASTPASNNNTGSGGTSNSSVNYTGTIGTWTVTDVISTVYNGTTYKLASDFAVNKPSNIVGNYYCLEIMNNSNFNVGVLEWKPVTEKMRRPTLFFSDPARIRVLFAKSYSGCDITGVYRLNTDGTLCDEMKTIQGIITLASPYKAPAGGLRVGIEAHGISGVDQIYVFTNEVTIPEGACSISYSLKVPGTLPNNSGYCVSFWPLGTYSEPWMESAPVNISCADIATAPINGEIPRGVWVNGSVQLPAPVPNGQTLGVTIKFEYQDPNEHPVFTCSGVINGNISSFNYTRPVKPGDYKVSYILYSTTDLLDYFAANRLLECAYYRINGPCTPFDGDIITIGSTSQEINLNVLNNGLLISGSAILPWQAHEDTDVYISSPSLPHYQGFAKIPAGSLSTNYTLVVPSGTVGTIYFFVGDVNGELTILSPLTADLPGQNIYLSTSSMASSSGKTHFNVPGPIEPNSILIGSTVFNLDSPDYTLDNLLIALTQLDSYCFKNGLLPSLGLYYKSPLPAWFDLNNPAIGNGSGLNDPANAIDPANLPELFGGIYPSSSMLGIHSSVLHYYVPQGFTGSIYLPFSPPTVNIAVSVGSTSSPVVLTDRGPVIYPQPMIRFDVDAKHPGLGTNSLAYTLENSSYSPSAVTTTIQVTSLPGLEIVDSSTPPKHCLEEGYAATTMTITGAAIGQATWNAGDPLTLVLSSGLGNKPVPQCSIDQSTVSVVYNQVSFTLPAGLPAEGFYCVELFRTGDSEPFALAPFPVCPAGNNSKINPGAVYNKADNILTIPVSGYEPYASLNPNKLTITSNGNSYTLGGTYMGMPDYASLSPGYFKYCPASNSFQVYLTGVDVSNMNSLASGPATLTAAYGWCIDAANNYAAATTGGINMVIVGP
ncbi:hypothetical protein [Syntrophomonas palmitatica]|uniref:hypothetical protein n=1 Tax=Syntrophomonas palmitatica TaxID=402877 RepID=UPI0006D19368|nr:hypothetical protein [Syntrophomonas palmitatica]